MVTTANSDDEIRAELGDKFPKHIYHSIICIGALIAHLQDDQWVVDALGAPHVGERSERDLAAALQRHDRVVSNLRAQRIGRARKYVADLIDAGHSGRVTIREALQQRIAAGDQQGADCLYVLELDKPKLLERTFGQSAAKEQQVASEQQEPQR